MCVCVCVCMCEFYFVFHDFVVWLRRLVLCHSFVMTFCYLLSYYNVLFVCKRFRRVKHIPLKTINQIMIVSIL